MKASVARIQKALCCISPDDRETWLHMGMAIKSELREDGFTVWNHWSQSSSAYQLQEARTVWRSIEPNGGITIGTLFHKAKENGWREAEQGSPLAPSTVPPRIAKEDTQKAQTAHKAEKLWQAGEAVKPNHPYLLQKKVDMVVACGILGYAPRSKETPLTGRLLIVPVTINEALSTVELIDETGRKASLAGRGTKKGGFWAAQSLPKNDSTKLTLLIGEGMATALSAQVATGHPAIAALSCHNLPTVAQAMRRRYPQAKLVILADVLKDTDKPNPKAIDAACACQGQLAVPDFGPNRSREATDFNDMAVLTEPAAVAKAIDSAQEPDCGGCLQDASTLQAPTMGSVKESGRGGGVRPLRGSDITPESIDWLWEDWLAAGKLHVLGGAPGTGKTTIALALASTITTGGSWPDGCPCHLKGIS